MPRLSEGKLPAKNPQCMLLGRVFREQRERRGISLAKLATGVDLCVNTLRRHEAGNMMLRVDDLERAAGMMGVDPSTLLKRGKLNGKPSDGTD